MPDLASPLFTRLIPLTKGYFTLVDVQDYPRLSRYKWHVAHSHGKPYACRFTGPHRKRTKIYLHRHLMQPPPGLEVDHINGNGLDNRRANLRVVTHRENMRNMLGRLLALLICIALTACSYTPSERLWFGAMVTGQAADAYTTSRGLDAGCEEANPLFGDSPSDSTIILVKGLGVSLIALVAHLGSRNRTFYYKLGAFLGIGAAAWNRTQM